MIRLPLTVRLGIFLVFLTSPLLALALQAPVISDQTTGPLFRTANSELVLNVGAGGNPEPAFQWHLNGKPIPGAVSFEYRLPKVQIEHAGAYTCVVKNSRGKKTTQPVQVAVVDPAASEQPLYLGKDSSLSARVANATGTAVWRKDGVILQDGGRYKDTAKTVLRITATTEEDLGTYTCEFITAAGALSPGPVHAVAVSEVPVVVDPEWSTLTTLRAGNQFTGDFEAEHHPAKFNISGLPPGLTANATTGEVTGRFTKPGSYTVKISATNAHGTGPVLTLPLTVESIRAEHAGSFVGLVYPNETNQNLGGLVTATITAEGKYTLKVRSGTRSASFAGVLQADAPYYTARSIARSGSGASTLWADLTLGTPVMLTVSQGPEDNHTPLFTTSLSQCATTVPSSLVGYHTLELSPVGFATGNITAKATASFAIRLPDGTAVTLGGSLTRDGYFLNQKLLYGNTGFVETGIQFLENEHDRGTVTWFKKPPVKPGRLLPDGVQETLTVYGSLWNQWDKVSSTRIKEGTLDVGGMLEDTFPVNAGRGYGFSSFDPEENPSRVLSFSLNPATGLFSGSVKIGYWTDTRSGDTRLVTTAQSFQGVLTSTGGEDVSGSGYFLLPGPPDPFENPPITLGNSQINPEYVTFSGSPSRSSDAFRRNQGTPAPATPETLRP